MDSSNPGIPGRVYYNTGFLRISDGTNTQPTGGPQGATGVQGLIGPAVHPGQLPSVFTTLTTPVYTTSSTFVNIPGLDSTLVLDASSCIYASMSLQTDSTGPGSYPTAGFRIVIHDSTGTELQRFILSDDDIELINVEHRSYTLSDGTYIIHGQYRVVEGTKTIEVIQGQLFAMGLIGAKGEAGATGIQGMTGAGIQGATGLMGDTGIQGMTGAGATGPMGDRKSVV